MIQKKESAPVVNKKLYMNILYVGVSVAALLVLGLFSLRTYKAYQGRKAQRILSESLQEFQTTTISYKPQWAEVKFMNELGAQQTAGTALQPYFVVMQAQALAQEGKFEDAVVRMQDAIDMLPSDSPYKAYYTLTKHLMQLDAPSQKEAGFAALQQLADDSAYPYRDAALYHVADYYNALNDDAHAKATWQKLVAESASFTGSPWVALAQQKLTTV